MNNQTDFDPVVRRRNRIMLVVLAALFLLPFVAATLLHVIGWTPQDTRNRGQLLEPPVSLADLDLRHADGAEYQWAAQERRWQVAVLPPADCATVCVELIAGLDKVWRLQGRRADRLQVLWFGPVPSEAVTFRTFVPMQPNSDLTARMPGLASEGAPTVYLYDPAGFLVMRYAPDFDLADLRADIAQLLK